MQQLHLPDDPLTCDPLTLSKVKVPGQGVFASPTRRSGLKIFGGSRFKRTFGHAPLLAYLDHGDGGTGEPLAVMLRPGRANANNAADNIAVLRAALTQLPEADRDRVLG